tara:strand:- start:739 stop:978 length:240 start_codon:yes stop_codon:yes gene_type:complete
MSIDINELIIKYAYNIRSRYIVLLNKKICFFLVNEKIKNEIVKIKIFITDTADPAMIEIGMAERIIKKYFSLNSSIFLN